MLQIPASVNYILDSLAAAGHEAYVVGGCVRDMLLKRQPSDWDICTSARPDEIKACFSGIEMDLVGEKYGTVTLLLSEERYEVTTFRTDGAYTDGCHPDVVIFSDSLKDDLARRDFTTNAMAFNPQTGLMDFFHGQNDLKKGVIRCVGDPGQWFQEDALRIMRALRFASVYRFWLDDETAASIHENRALLERVSNERVRKELCKLLLGKGVMRICREYRDVLAVVVPEITPCFDFKQNSPYHIYDVWEHILHALDESTEDLIVRLAVFFHDIGKPQCYFVDENGGHFHGHGKVSAGLAQEIMQRLCFDGATVDTVTELVEIHGRFIEPSEKAVRRLLSRLGQEQFERLMDVRAADVNAQTPECIPQRLDKIANLRTIASRILARNDCFSLRNLAITGTDLIVLGYPIGPRIGEELRKLFELVLDDPSLNERNHLLELAKRAL